MSENSKNSNTQFLNFKQARVKVTKPVWVRVTVTAREKKNLTLTV